MELRQWQLFEEDTRHKATTKALSSSEEPSVSSTAGTLSEFHVIQEMCGQSEIADNEADVQILAGKDRIQKLLRRKEFKLATLKRKIGRTTKELSKLNSMWNPSEEEPDQELMTDEERECLKKIGLRMSGVLVLGRRGVFDGVIEGMHQHWKHREVVKKRGCTSTDMRSVYVDNGQLQDLLQELSDSASSASWCARHGSAVTLSSMLRHNASEVCVSSFFPSVLGALKTNVKDDFCSWCARHG